ncbi:MAG: NAD(P)H-dependent oxidoreductase subunit E [Burkholderiaceae bacterium]|nr:NAD(P)H-dependent oxidoreductase subunit E [Burkholderiaceae bacterium]
MSSATRTAQGKGRRVDPQDRKRLGQLLGDAERRPDLLIELLHLIQDAEGHLAVGLLAALAEELRLSQAEVFEVATFYHHFDVVRDGEAAPPALTVRVCESVACELAGSARLAERLRQTLGTAVRVQAVPCVGRCAQAPVAVVHQHPVAPATVELVQRMVLTGTRDCPPPGALGGDARTGGAGTDFAALRELLAGALPEKSRTNGQAPSSPNGELELRTAVCDAIDASGLRGMGGAGFPTGRKWRIVATQPGPRMLVVNADEGEPGTFKDRHHLEHGARRFLEGMLIAAWVIDAERCTIYLRDEYAGVRALLTAEIAALRSGTRLPGSWRLPPIELRRGAGAYICGEESAMLESIEGKRGMPRLRPPYVAERGLFDRPTLVHNVETLWWVPEILAGGAAAFAGRGRRGHKGPRSFSVSGRVVSPGVKVAPAGITLRELIEEYCGGMLPGHELHGYLPGGASGGILPAALADLPLDFGTLEAHGCFIGSAAIVVLSQHDSVREVAQALMEFFRKESCGQCTPCRVGTAHAAELMRAGQWDVPLLLELAQVMSDASICGLGQAAPNPLISALRHFPAEFNATERRAFEDRSEPRALEEAK